MSNKRSCLLCGKKIDCWDKTCMYCGTNQFGKNNEFYPDEKALRQAKRMLAFKEPKQKKKKSGLTTEEIFFAGMHPKDDLYRKVLELDILSKKR